MTALRPRYISLQAGRGIAAVLVVVHHAAAFLDLVWGRPEIFRRFQGPRLGVAFFFVLSGIVILTAHRRDIGHPSSVPSYLWKRFRRIYPIYWVVLIATLLVQHSNHTAEIVAQRQPLVVLSAMFLVPIRPEHILPVSWTLYHEALFYLLFAVVLLNRRIGYALLAVWMIAAAFHFAGAEVDRSAFSGMHLLFGMGMAASWLLYKDKVPLPGLLLSIGSLLFGAVVVLQGFLTIPGWAPLLAGFGCMLALLGAAKLETQGKLSVAPWLAFLGDASYSIYLVHWGVMSKAATIFHSRIHLPAACLMTLLIVIGVVSGCLLHVFVERPLLAWLGRLGKSVPPRPATAVA
jgi:peptidoglycan/LPS O-acetylase OafA/YrhL